MFAGPVGLLIPLTQHGARLAFFVVGWFAFSLAFTAYNVTGVSLRQTLCPPRLLGRMNATMRFVTLGVMPFGALIGGILGRALGARETLWIALAGELLAPVVVLASPMRSMREAPTGADLRPDSEPASDAGPEARQRRGAEAAPTLIEANEGARSREA